MQIEVNNQSRDVQEQASLQHLLQQLGYKQPKGVAVAVNERVIPKAEWEKHQLQANDKVMIITATQGG